VRYEGILAGGKAIAGRCSVSHVDFIVFPRTHICRISRISLPRRKLGPGMDARKNARVFVTFASGELDYYLFNSVLRGGRNV
jgi:hypothetical protein